MDSITQDMLTVMSSMEDIDHHSGEVLLLHPEYSCDLPRTVVTRILSKVNLDDRGDLRLEALSMIEEYEK
jgi:hypothetical protein